MQASFTEEAPKARTETKTDAAQKVDAAQSEVKVKLVANDSKL